MLIFGHAGITLGAATLLTGALSSSRFSQKVPAANPSPGDKVSWFTYLGSYIDIRLLLIGSLLPDIVDKPIGKD